jgi:enamine deaminase RidA (YjgF/YER057c/UK114 family)
MPLRLAAAVIAVLFLFASTAPAQRGKKKKKGEEEVTQVLEIPRDPPAVSVGDASRLVFHATPLSAKGLLSQQTRDALKSLFSQLRGAQVVRIRAFVAGSGDLRRIPPIVSEVFTDKRLPIPAVTVLQVGGLPLEGAQVLLEAISADRKAVNPAGLAFISGQVGVAKDAAGPLIKTLGIANLQTSAVRRVSCFLNSLEHLNDARQQITTAFPKAPATFIQLRRDSTGDFIECEAVAALATAPPQSPGFLGIMERGYSQIAVTGPGRLAFSGTQLAFGREEKDVRLAFERLTRTLETSGASLRTVIMSNTYPLTNAVTEQIRKIRPELFNAKTPPASTLLLFEGLSSPDASFGTDVIASVGQP